MDKYFISASPDASLIDLLDSFWNLGVGNVLSKGGSETPWTLNTIMNALSDRDISLSERTIQNWFTVEARTTPQETQIIEFCKLIEDSACALSWRRALIKTAKQNRKSGKQAKQFAGSAEPMNSGRRSNKFYQPERRQILIGVLATSALLVMGVFLATSSLQQSSSPSIQVTFCSADNFEIGAKRCRSAQYLFPAGTKTVFINIDIDGLEPGKPFARRWFHNNWRMFETDRITYLVEPWENWTYLGSENPDSDSASFMDAGAYTLNIIIDENATAWSFLIEGEELGRRKM